MEKYSGPSQQKVIGIFPQWLGSDSQRGPHPVSFLDKHIRHKSGPRSLAYMKDCFFQFFPEGKFEMVTSPQENLNSLSIQNQEIVILYPDAIGLGMGKLEKLIQGQNPARVQVLNGRRRIFTLDAKNLKRLRWKRFLEMSFLVEIFWSLKLLLLFPFWVLSDLLRGKK